MLFVDRAFAGEHGHSHEHDQHHHEDVDEKAKTNAKLIFDNENDARKISVNPISHEAPPI